jgi:hypothetical protein|tara:strand:- start:2919 stop:3149 length:231 start_codon:yes stop_codon:yes gene_type:complete
MWEFYVHIAIALAILVTDDIHSKRAKTQEDEIFAKEQWLEEQKEKGILVDDLIYISPDTTVSDTLKENSNDKHWME